ncbi:hypothetical protein PYH37_005233 [Sinorhizobium numidicum]|uniref:Uncharacterized protein n=1 Tax=Sinorhizobium numidicum TaxID=680248 RepID=A0ABY8CZI4_9HYPH|nr:hypothetical protein [Sinorhizobium numidicum]WEX76882.1 hypothetical protein PYH37_005233 [Sinorhizobium numidicum]WEX83542.1 hypothetical protein PYH38_002326 [Sinorhizobium numidicum]
MNEYKPMHFTVMGLEIPDDGDEAAILGMDIENNLLAITVDFASALNLLENSSKAIEVLSVRQRGNLAHIPVKADVSHDPEAPEKITLALRFGTIGILNCVVTSKQAEELARDIERTLSAAR